MVPSVCTSIIFLSTLSLRRATATLLTGTDNYTISIHALLAESDILKSMSVMVISISIHALLAESDFQLVRGVARCVVFLSTLSLRRATVAGSCRNGVIGISIHALLAESDLSTGRADTSTNNHFYPRSPCGERPVTARIIDPTYGFLSTLSLRRATVIPEVYHDNMLFLSTLSLRRATIASFFGNGDVVFLSTLSLRRATRHNTQDTTPICISIHALLAESDAPLADGAQAHATFLSTLSLRRATFLSDLSMETLSYFYPRSPCGERHPARSKTIG